MRFTFASFASVFLGACFAFASPTLRLRDIEKYDGETTGLHIIRLKKGVSKRDFITNLGLNTTVEYDIFNGFAGNFSSAALYDIRASKDVETVAEDGFMYACMVQTDASWGLARLGQGEKLSNRDDNDIITHKYKYNFDASPGKGVDIYILDSGVDIKHREFGKRARSGQHFTASGEDKFGHGTYVAGIAAGGRWGVAKDANIISVKVMDDKGQAAEANVISGLEWVIKQKKKTKSPSVVNLSASGDLTSALEDAFKKVIASGIHLVIAAGNDNKKTAKNSLGAIPSVINVGASTIEDTRHKKSNYGPFVPIYAPGRYITGPRSGSYDAYDIKSGTSAAAPYVAGLVAYFLGKDPNVKPSAMSFYMQAVARQKVLHDLPEGSKNYLASNRWDKNMMDLVKKIHS